jgi:hypothetical protein
MSICDIENSKMRRPMSELGALAPQKEIEETNTMTQIKILLIE